MAHAYTPGLRVSELTILRKERTLPLKGEVVVREGDPVRADQVVARTELPGNVHSVNVANILSVLPDEVPSKMEKKEGDPVQKDEVLELHFKVDNGGQEWMYVNVPNQQVSGFLSGDTMME